MPTPVQKPIVLEALKCQELRTFTIGVQKLRSVVSPHTESIAAIGIIDQSSVNRSAELTVDSLADRIGESISPELRKRAVMIFGAEYPSQP